jgi:uroporphyrin-3 C-methyltransferase
MSKKNESDDAAPEPEPESEDAAPESRPEPEAPRATQRSSRVAWLALFASLIALSAVGYTIYKDWRTQQDLTLSSGNIQDSIVNLAGRIDTAKESLLSIETRLAALVEADAGIAGDVDGLERDLNDRMRQIDALPSRISDLELSLATLQGISTGAKDTWLLGEAEYYMQLANAQLQLAGNPESAARALDMADERIAQLANPALTDVRRALADELAALEGMATPDIEGLSLTLASLARVVESLPLRRIERLQEEPTEGSDEEIGPLDRAWNSVKQAAAGLVKHRSTDQEIMPLISPEAEYFLRTNLTLQLQTARLSLLRGEQAIFEQSLDDATAWLTLYFDPESAAVDGATRTIGEIRDGMISAAPPDISESLRLLRRFNTQPGSAQ